MSDLAACDAPLPSRPVVAGFYPDPTVCRAEGWYYLACSSFEYAPGVPVFRSADLVNWDHIGNALERPTQLCPSRLRPSGGVWAPTVRFHDGRFWLVTTDGSAGPGQLLVTASDPAGPWSDPVRITAATGIDPDLAWSDDGTCLLTWRALDLQPGVEWFADGRHENCWLDGGIRQAPIDVETGALLAPPTQLWTGTGGRAVEAPHLYRRGQWWYQMVAEGGTGPGHAVTVARAASPDGPYEPSPYNPLLTARGRAGAVQNAGHGDLIERGDGTWAIVFLGVRPAGTFPTWHVLGREVFAAQVEWLDDWPTLGAPIEPAVAPGVRRTLPDNGPLGPEWVAVNAFAADLLRRLPKGWTLSAPTSERTFAGIRQERRACVVRARLDVAGPAVGGLEARIDAEHAVAIEQTAHGDAVRVRAVARVGSMEHTLGHIVTRDGVELELRTQAPPATLHPRRRGPDMIVATAHTQDGAVELGRLDGRYVSTEVAGGFTGRVIGVTASHADIVVRRFECHGLQED